MTISKSTHLSPKEKAAYCKRPDVIGFAEDEVIPDAQIHSAMELLPYIEHIGQDKTLLDRWRNEASESIPRPAILDEEISSATLEEFLIDNNMSKLKSIMSSSVELDVSKLDFS